MNLPAIRINPLGITIVLFGVMFLISLYASGIHRKNYKITTVNLKHLLAVGLSVAEMGGSKVREVRLSSNLNQQSKGETKEGADDPLTDGDLRSHRMMMLILKKTFPDLKVVSEEHDAKQEDPVNKELPLPQWDVVKKLTDDVDVPIEDVVVWIDPLDATQEYTENLIKYVTTMVCVSVKGKPVIGIIHQPFKNHTAWAWVDYGTSTDSDFASKYHVPEDSFRIIVSKSHTGKAGEVAKKAFGPKTEVIEAGGAGYKALQVAQGKADIYIHVTAIKKWDICAGNAVLNALGGTMTTLDGKMIEYGDPLDFKNGKGLIASLAGNEKYVKKLSDIKI